jgi:cation diffusion facilitator family transporter
MASESRTAVYGALAGNALIAITKFGGAALTGSSAMLSEGVHSTVDTGNEALLLLGMKRAKRPADTEHPFGHGKELYFWSLIVAVLIFGVGGGISAYEGILHMLKPAPLEEAKWNYIVLGCAFVFESISLGIALHSFSKQKGDGPFWQELRKSKDPSVFTVIAEDAAALAGILVAFGGVYASHMLNMPVLDGLASLIIGVLLAGVATVLMYETRGLLIGESVDKQMAEEIRRLAVDGDVVRSAANPMTMYFGPEEVLLNLEVEFTAAASMDDISAGIDEMENRIRERFPIIKRIFIEATHLGANGRRTPAGRRV